MRTTHQERIDARWMRAALELAVKNTHKTRPNPSVGALLVKNNRKLSSGATEPPGGRHAEVVALDKAKDRAQGVTLYVTLEPCSHTRKRTPPCVPRIIASGVRRVVIGSREKNPNVKGVAALRRAGIIVTTGVLREETDALYAPFFHWITTGKPLVTVHIAQTLDGKMTWGDGRGKRVTGAAAQRKLHEQRAEHDAVLVGIGTVMADDPALTAHGRGRDPARIILDPQLKISARARVLRRGEVILIHASASRKRFPAHVARIKLPARNGTFSVPAIVRALGNLGIRSVYVEGGVRVCRSFLPYAHRLELFIAPKVVGEGRGVFDEPSPDLPFVTVASERLGRDLLVRSIKKNI